jgi:CMP-N-acetylneuraminic acid synthetase
MKILAIIPARGGSKRLPRKNIKILNGKPLISYSIEAASKSNYINKIVVSTDDYEIKNISKTEDLEIVDRPKELAKDDSSTFDAIKHSLDVLEEQDYVPDIVVLLQPTSPLRTTEDIDNSIELFIENDCNSVISVCEFEHSPYWSLRIENKYLKPNFGQKYFTMRRQELPDLYLPNGAIFISKVDDLMKLKSFYGKKILPYIMPSNRSIDIDTELDFKLIELILREVNETD